MIYTLMVEDGFFGVNREFRKVSMRGVDKDIAVIQFDTERQTGVIQWKSGVTDDVPVRDLEGERLEYEAAVRDNKPLERLRPRMKRQRVRRARKVISDFAEFEFLLERWDTATS